MNNPDAPRRGRGRPKGSRNKSKGNGAIQPQALPKKNNPERAKSAADELRQTVAQIDARIAFAQANGSEPLSPLYNSKTNALAKLAKLTGEDEVSMQQIVRSKAWADYLARLEAALEGFPDCWVTVEKAFADD